MGDVIGKTDILGGPRGIEIQHYLDSYPAHPTLKFVILDDSDDMVHLTKYLVRTSGQVGLTQAHVDRAAEMLGATVRGEDE